MATTFNDGYQSITHPLSYSFYALVQTIEGSASLTATGSTTTAAGLVEHLASAVVGAGSVAVVAIGHRRGVAALSGSGTVSAEGQGTLLNTSAISGAGTVAASAYQIDFGASAMSGSATLAAIGAEILEGASAPSGTGSVSATSYKEAYIASAISATGSSATVAMEVLITTSAITGNGTVAIVLPILEKSLASAISGTGAVASTSYKEAYAVSAPSGAGTVAATGTEVLYGTVQPLSVGSIAVVSTEILHALPSGMSGTGTVAAVGTEVLFGSYPGPGISDASGEGTLTATGHKERFLEAAVSGSGSVSATGYEILYAGKNIGGSGTVAAVGYEELYTSVAASGACTISASGIVERMGSAAISASATIVAIRTINFASAVTGRGTLETMYPYLYLVQIDGTPVTEQNRKFGIVEKYNSRASVTRADGATNQFKPEDSNKKVIRIDWSFIGNDEESNFDFRKGRDFIKSVADDGLEHTVKIRDNDSFFGSQTYTTIVKSYREVLRRRAVTTNTVDGSISNDAEVGRPLASDSNYGAYFWDVSLELEEV